MPAEPIQLTFPIKGVSDGWGFAAQPEGTSPDALNVIPLDVIAGRIRGGQRWGDSKYFSTLHNGANKIQRITSITEATTAGDVTGSTQTFTASDGFIYTVLPSTFDYWIGWWRDDDTEIMFGQEVITDANSQEIVSNELKSRWDGSMFDQTTSFVLPDNVNLDDGVSMSLKVRVPDYDTTGSLQQCTQGFFWKLNPTYASNECWVVGISILFWGSGGGAKDQKAFIEATFNKVSAAGTDSGEYKEIVGTFGSPDAATFAALNTTGITLHFSVTAAGQISVWVDSGTPVVFSTGPDTSYDAYQRIGFFTDALPLASSFEYYYADDFTYAVTGLPPISRRAYRILAVNDGDLYSGRPSDTALTLVTGGTDVVGDENIVDMQTAFGKVYICDGDPANYSIYDNDAVSVGTWTPTDGTLPMGSDQTLHPVTAAAAAGPTFTIAGDLSSLSAGDYLHIAGTTSNNGFYTVVSTSGTGPTVITVNETVVDQATEGTLQYQNHACNIIKLYRGRIVMSGLVTDPHNWFMARAAFPLDWDYGAELTATMPVAGNNTDAGISPDIITCLAPFSDDLMWIGGDHTLWLMRGDPADRGRIDNVSYRTGISGPDAYSFDPNGTFYFFGSGTLWRATPDGVPEPVSRNRFDQTFGAIDTRNNNVMLQWDNIRHGLHILVIPKEGGTTTHFWYDERTDSIWPIQFPADHVSTAYLYDGDLPADTAIIFGGFDGYLRKIDLDSNNDDGTAISSYVLYSPVLVAGPEKNLRLNSITTIMDTQSNDVEMTVYAENTPQKVVEASTVRFKRIVAGGRTVIPNRTRGNAVMIKLSNSTLNTTWAVESITANMEGAGRARHGTTDNP